MSCLHYCCYCCCYCCDQCCPHRKEKPNRYPHIEYKSPTQALHSTSSHRGSEKPPLHRRYEFLQPQAEAYSSHILMPVPVMEQPRRYSYPMSTAPNPIATAPSPIASAPSPIASRSINLSPGPSPVHSRCFGGTDISETTSDAGTMSSLQLSTDLQPSLQFSLYYDVQRRSLAVHIQQAYNLPFVTHGTTNFPCSPLVVLFLLPNKDQIFESKVVKKNSNPNFDQMFEFGGLLPEDVRKQTILMKVFHRARRGNDLIGVLVLSLEDADLYGVSINMKIDKKVEKFSQTSKGQLLFSLSYKPAIHALQGIVLRAKNIQKSSNTGTASPYMKVYLVHHGKRQHKWRSSIKRNTLMPIFNEAFRFDVSAMDLKNLSLELLLMDHNRFSGDEVLGIVRVGEHCPDETGQSHWNELFLTPDHAVSRWHSVWPITHVYDGSSDRESIN